MPRAGHLTTRSFRLGGVIPVKTVRAEVLGRRVVQVCGTPFGIKMFANGAMVVGFSDIYTAQGYQNPAKTAGLKLGDVIVSIAGHETRTQRGCGRGPAGAERARLPRWYSSATGMKRRCA